MLTAYIAYFGVTEANIAVKKSVIGIDSAHNVLFPGFVPLRP